MGGGEDAAGYIGFALSVGTALGPRTGLLEAHIVAHLPEGFCPRTPSSDHNRGLDLAASPINRTRRLVTDTE